jgi:anthranilate synthase/aminodeoxychorismate synthase-like glutamine amidotransferase
MLLLIDNYDSFTYNLVQGFGSLDPSIELRVARNDRITIDEIEDCRPTHIVLSPGPGTPNDAGVCNDVIAYFKGRIPILGVCLGHQCIGQVFGMSIVRAGSIMHGKTSPVHHDGRTIFKGIPNPFTATRYHSLIINPQTFNESEFERSAWTEDGVIMGIRWKGDRSGNSVPLDGVQFHPESFLTIQGPALLANFLGIRPAVNARA